MTLIDFNPQIAYKCPNCGNPYIASQYMSYNTFGATFYTDGTCCAPMKPKLDWVTRCPKCGEFFAKEFLTEIKPIPTTYIVRKDLARCGRVDDCFDVNDAWINGLYFPPATPQDKIAKIHLQLRISRWRYDNHNEPRITGYKENCLEILKELNPTDDQSRLIVAEINRNIGDFDASIKMLGNIDNYSKYSNYIASIGKYARNKQTNTATLLDANDVLYVFDVINIEHRDKLLAEKSILAVFANENDIDIIRHNDPYVSSKRYKAILRVDNGIVKAVHDTYGHNARDAVIQFFIGKDLSKYAKHLTCELSLKEIL